MEIYFNGNYKRVYGIIYKITNTVNNKVYIGQTTQGFNKRYHNDVYRNTHNKYLKHDIEVFGMKKFNISSIFDYGITKDELDYKEEYWINHYNSNNINYGYNIVAGRHIDNKEQMLIYKDIVTKHKVNRDSITTLELDELLNFKPVKKVRKKKYNKLKKPVKLNNKSKVKKETKPVVEPKKDIKIEVVKVKKKEKIKKEVKKEIKEEIKEIKPIASLSNININDYLNIYLYRTVIHDIKIKCNCNTINELEDLLNKHDYILSLKQHNNKSGYIIKDKKQESNKPDKELCKRYASLFWS